MSNQTVQDVKDRLDIVEVITNYIPAKKSGANYKAVCPFHNEKTPSLMISPSKQIWHCFGCGEGGDVLKFMMQYENIEFPEALQKAASLAGVQLPQFKPANPEKKKAEDHLKRINRFAASVYQKNLQSGKSARAMEYLTERGLNQKTIERWQIGYAPDSFDFLTSFLQAKDVNLDLAITAGVLGKSHNGKIYDRFRDRVMFPIHNIDGDVVGFSARAMPGADAETAKYINSPETPIYNKSKELFGLCFAKDALRRSRQVVVVEGQMDAIQAHQAGFTDTIATSGTALTELQIKILKRFAQTVVLAFDSDEAGQRAALRAAHVALDAGLVTKVASYASDSDPDQIIKSSPKQWERVVKQSKAAIDYYLAQAQTNYELGSLDQKHYISETVIPLLRYIGSSLEHDHYVQKISQDFAIGQSAITAELQQSQQQTAGSSRKTEQSTVKPSAVNPEETWEKEILGGIIVYSDFKEFVLTEGLSERYLSQKHKDYFAQALAGEDLAKSADSVVQEAIFMVESSLENLQDNELAQQRELKKSFYLLKLSGLRHYLKELTIAIKKAELNQNIRAVEQLNVKFAEISKLRFEIETKLQQA